MGALAVSLIVTVFAGAVFVDAYAEAARRARVSAAWRARRRAVRSF